MSVHYRVKGDYLLIVGHTYPHRDVIRGLGASFDRDEKVWKLLNTTQMQAKVAAFCAGLGGGALEIQEAPRNDVDLRQSPAPVFQPTQTPAADLGISPNSDKPGYTVGELMTAVQLSISQLFPSAVWVTGEIQNLNHRGNGMYFSLAEAKDKETKAGTVTVSATLWSSAIRNIERKIALKDIMGDGMQVRLLCQVGLYRDRGMVSLNVLDVDPSFTKGALALAREQLLRELRQFGLDKKNKERTLNPFPFRIGLISADQSRAKSDFLNQLETYRYNGEVIFQDARMQGERIVAEVLSAIRGMIEAGVDAIVLTRGGGSAADLRWFDHRDIALAIAHCPIPVIAAIGHHDDVCVAEMICYQREKTPTAAADFILSRLNQTRERISMLAEAASKTVNNRLISEEKTLQRLKDHLGLAAISSLERKREALFRSFARLQDASQSRLNAESVRTLRYAQALQMAAGGNLNQHEHALIKLEAALQARDPKPWLQKGWTQIYNADKTLIKSTKDLQRGMHIHARLLDGSFDASVENINELGVKS